MLGPSQPLPYDADKEEMLPILNAENFLNAQTIALRTPLNYPLQNSHRALLTRLWVQILLGLAFVLSSLQSLLHRESCPNYLCF